MRWPWCKGDVPAGTERNHLRIARITREWDQRRRLERDDIEWLVASSRFYILRVPNTRWQFGSWSFLEGVDIYPLQQAGCTHCENGAYFCACKEPDLARQMESELMAAQAEIEAEEPRD